MTKVVAVDFDGTLCTNAWPNIGVIDIFQKRVIQRLCELHKAGWVIILWTCREGKYLEDAVKFCVNNSIPIDYINENIPEIKETFGDSRKICADLYIDDRAVNNLDILKLKGVQ